MAVTALNRDQQLLRILAWVFFVEVLALGYLMLAHGGAL